MSKGIALIIFLVPIITICISYVISAFYGYVDWCLPIIDGCTSISKVGRYGISFYLYKILVIPSVILMIYFWLKVYLDVYKNIFLLFLSFIACIFLIIYLIALGFDGPIYRFMREVGIFAFFVFMPICQIWLTASAPKESLKTTSMENIISKDASMSFSNVCLRLLCGVFCLLCVVVLQAAFFNTLRHYQIFPA